MAGDARAFLAERFLGDLNDDVLPGLQHFGNQLRTARWAGMAALIATVMPGAAGTAFESRSAWATATIGTPPTTVGAPSATIRASAAIVAAPIPAAAAERPLEARARVAANACGTARELFARGTGTADTRRAGFTREKDYVFFDDRSFHGSFAGSGRKHFLFHMLCFEGLGSGMLFLVFLLVFVFTFMRVLGFSVVVFAEIGRMDGAVVGKVRFSFGAVDGALFFDVFRFFRREFRVLRSADGFRLAGFFFGLFFFEFGAGNHGIRFRYCLFVFRLDEARCECGDLIFVQFDLIAHRFGFDDRTLYGARFFYWGRNLPRRCCLGFGTAIGQEPARKAAGEPAGNITSGRNRRNVARRSLRIIFYRRLQFVNLMLGYRWRWSSCCGLAAILGERFAGKDYRLLGGLYWSNRA